MSAQCQRCFGSFDEGRRDERQRAVKRKAYTEFVPGKIAEFILPIGNPYQFPNSRMIHPI